MGIRVEQQGKQEPEDKVKMKEEPIAENKAESTNTSW